MKTRIILLLVLISLFLITGCTKTVEEITSDDSYVGETVRVSGMVMLPTKIGSLSGYTLVDKNEDPIVVASEKLPEEGKKIIVKGTLKEGPLGLGYYIDVDE